MGKLQRITGKVFGETASATGDADIGPYIGQFGSAKLGTYYGTTDVSEIQNLTAWSNGFIDAVTPSNQYPTLPEMTGVLKVLSHQGCYNLQQGIPEYDANTEYYTNGFCSYDDEIYISLQDSNTGNQPDISPTYWQKYSDRFLNYHQISNCALEYDSSYISVSGKVLTIKKGLKVLIADGRMSNGTLKNIEYVVPSDLTVDFSGFATGQERTVFLTKNGALLATTNDYITGYFRGVDYPPSTVPSTGTYYIFISGTNSWYSTSGSTTANWQPISIIPLATVHVYSDTIGIHADLPISIADTTMVSGEWETQNLAIASSVTYPTSTDITYDISNYIHWDRFIYEVLLSATVTATGISGNESGNQVQLAVLTDIAASPVFICGAHTRVSSNIVNTGNVIIPTRNRKITVRANSNYKGTFNLNMRAFRRIGANG